MGKRGKELRPLGLWVKNGKKERGSPTPWVMGGESGKVTAPLNDVAFAGAVG